MCSVVWGSNHNFVSARTEQTGKPCFASSGKEVTSTAGNKVWMSPWFGIRIRGSPTSSWSLICVQISAHRTSTPCISSSAPWESPGAMAAPLSWAHPAPPCPRSWLWNTIKIPSKYQSKNWLIPGLVAGKIQDEPGKSVGPESKEVLRKGLRTWGGPADLGRARYALGRAPSDLSLNNLRKKVMKTIYYNPEDKHPESILI